MKSVTKFLTAAAAAVTMMIGAGAANAATTFNHIELTGAGSDHFGADYIAPTDNGFVHTFTFLLSEAGKASSSITTMILGQKDVDIFSVVLDGVSFVQTSFDPSAELWELNPTLLGLGEHTVTVKGKFTGAGEGSYAGMFSIAAVPEPATWALMIMGFGGAGIMIRRRRATAAFA